MNRSIFLKSFVGLIGVTGSLKELSLLNSPSCALILHGTKQGDLCMNDKDELFFFDGKFIRNVLGGTPILAKMTDSPTYFTLSNPCNDFDEEMESEIWRSHQGISKEDHSKILKHWQEAYDRTNNDRQLGK